MKRTIALAVLALATLVAPTAASAQTEEGASFSFSPSRTGAAAGATFAAVLSGDRVTDQLQLRFPAGTRVTPAGAPRCDRTYEQAIAGDSTLRTACPSRTVVGQGTATATVGGNPVTFDLTVFNLRDTLGLAFETDGNEAFTSTVRARGRVLTVSLALAAELDARATEFGLAFLRRTGFIRTPRSCPAGRRYAAAVVARSGGTNRTLAATQRCPRP